MNWLLETLTEPSMIQAVAVISIVAAVGVYLGQSHIRYVPRIFRIHL